MVFGSLKCLIGRHQWEKHDTILDKSTHAMASQGFHKIGCFRCPATKIVKRPINFTKEQVDKIGTCKKTH